MNDYQNNFDEFENEDDFNPNERIMEFALEDKGRLGLTMEETPGHVVVQLELRHADGRKSERVWVRIDRNKGTAISCTSDVARAGLTS